MIMVIVCLVVAAVICGLLLKMAVLARETADGQHRSAQARWLAESAVERAVARLAQDARYSGETWTLPPAELPHGGLVRIAVETPHGQAGLAPGPRRGALSRRSGPRLPVYERSGGGNTLTITRSPSGT